MQKTENALFKIVGMYCTSCKPIVEKQLKNEQAIAKIDIDYMTDSIIKGDSPGKAVVLYKNDKQV